LLSCDALQVNHFDGYPLKEEEAHKVECNQSLVFKAKALKTFVKGKLYQTEGEIQMKQLVLGFSSLITFDNINIHL